MDCSLTVFIHEEVSVTTYTNYSFTAMSGLDMEFELEREQLTTLKDLLWYGYLPLLVISFCNLPECLHFSSFPIPWSVQA